MTTATSLIVIMIAAGLSGGLINGLLGPREGADGQLNGRHLSGSILVATGFALLSPLLLKSVSSPLLETLLDPKQSTWADVLSFGGLSLLAAIGSRLLIRSEKTNAPTALQQEIDDVKISAQRATVELDQMRATLNMLLNHFTERDEPMVLPPVPSANQMRLLAAMEDDRFAWRTIQSICQRSGLSSPEALTQLTALESEGYVSRMHKRHGDVWTLDPKGLDTLAHTTHIQR